MFWIKVSKKTCYLILGKEALALGRYIHYFAGVGICVLVALASASFLAEISVRSPRKLIIFII